MKRGWIGFALLLVLLAGGLLSSRYMIRQHSPLARELESAQEYALAGDWETAEQLLNRIAADWTRGWKAAALFADHGPMEEIDGKLARLETYCAQRSALPFAAACAELGRLMEAVADAHRLSWENLF